jgi:hypothetical protein
MGSCCLERQRTGEVFLQEIRYELEAMRAAVTSRAARRLSIEPGLEEVRAKMLHRADDQSEIDILKAMFERDDQELRLPRSLT